MFERLIGYIQGIFGKLFKNTELKTAIGNDTALSDTMIDKITQWGDMYSGKADWIDDYIKSIHLEQGISAEFANICLSEMTAESSNKKMNDIFQKAIRDLNENLQLGIAVGSFIVKPIGADKVEYYNAGKFVPVEYDTRGMLIDVAFIDERIVNKQYYRRFERHISKDNILTITNTAYVSPVKDCLGIQCDLNAIDVWQNLKPIVQYAYSKPDYGYYRNPIPNTVDGSKNGVSIYEPAVELIHDADEHYARTKWEFESGERAVDVDASAMQAMPTRTADGKTNYITPRLNRRLFRALNLSGGNGQDLYQVFSPEFRDVSMIHGMNTILRRIEFACKLAYGDLSDVQETEKTATEIKASKARKYNMVNAIEQNVEECLQDLHDALAFYNAMSTTGATLTIKFSDSILSDEETERKQDMADVAALLLNGYEYRMKWMGETETQAKANLPTAPDTEY